MSGAVIDRTGYKRLPIGSEDFAEVVSKRVYVDKSELIRDLIDSAYKVTLFCRPRRFGKSLAMRMLQCFFEAPIDNSSRSIPDYSHLFDDLAISREGNQYLGEMGAHPVIFLGLGSIGGSDWKETQSQFMFVMAQEFNRHDYVLRSGKLSDAELRTFKNIANQQESYGELINSLSFLSDLLCRYHGSSTVILIDEYDHPVTSGYLHGYREEAIGFTRDWLTSALKSTTSLRLACLTGVQRVSRESIFSGLNNLVVNTAMDGRFTEGFGFTKAEAEELARYCGLSSDRLSEMHDWYDGYCFGGTEVYNPWSVLNYIEQGGMAQPYWGNTSDNAIVHQLFSLANGNAADELRSLAAGEDVVEPLNLATVFSELDGMEPGVDGGSDGALWGQLYLAGYVTTDDVAFPNDATRERRLRVPNREVAYLYRSEFIERSVRVYGRDRLRAFRAALTGGDADGLERALRTVLDSSASYYDFTSENSYHMLTLGLVYNIPGYRFPRSNYERGDGRPDIALEPELENQGRLPAIVIELKCADAHGHATDDETEGKLSRLATEALDQIDVKRYGAGLHGSGLIKWGISFEGKHARCACQRED